MRASIFSVAELSVEFRQAKIALLAAAMLGGCAGGSQLPAAAPGSESASIVMPDALPPACKAQKKTQKYASVTETLNANGGSLCIPRFGAFGGTLNVPMATVSDKVTLISSTTNYANVPPPKASGSPIFYLNITPASTTSFGARVKAGGGLTGKGVKAKKTYTGYLEGYAFSSWRVLTNCYGVATSGKYGGVLSGLGSLFENQADYSAFEVFVYAGKYGHTKC